MQSFKIVALLLLTVLGGYVKFTLKYFIVGGEVVRLPEPWNYLLSLTISYQRNISKLLRAQKFQGSGVATPLERLL